MPQTDMRKRNGPTYSLENSHDVVSVVHKSNIAFGEVLTFEEIKKP